jgi:hypothetical protein
MFGSETVKQTGMSQKKLVSTDEYSAEWDDDPLKSIIMIYGQEDGGTTSLACSIVDAIDANSELAGKKVYVLLTEMAHNFSGIVKKHFPSYQTANRFVLPTMEYGGKIVPRTISTREEFLDWCAFIGTQKDMGGIIVDALDTLRDILFMYYFEKYPGKENMNYTSADADLRNMFFLKVVNLQIPVVVIAKHKEEVIYHTEGKKLLDIEKTGKIVPTIAGQRLLRWTTIRLWCEEVGQYTVFKAKGPVETGMEFSFGFGAQKHIRTGTWLPQLLNYMRGIGKPPVMAQKGVHAAFGGAEKKPVEEKKIPEEKPAWV